MQSVFEEYLESANEAQRSGDETYLKTLHAHLKQGNNVPLSSQEKIVLLTMLNKAQPRFAFVEEQEEKEMKRGDWDQAKVGSRKLFQDVKEMRLTPIPSINIAYHLPQ